MNITRARLSFCAQGFRGDVNAWTTAVRVSASRAVVARERGVMSDAAKWPRYSDCNAPVCWPGRSRFAACVRHLARIGCVRAGLLRWVRDGAWPTLAEASPNRLAVRQGELPGVGLRWCTLTAGFRFKVRNAFPAGPRCRCWRIRATFQASGALGTALRTFLDPIRLVVLDSRGFGTTM